MNLEQFLQKYPNVSVTDFMQAAFNIVNAIEEAREEIAEINSRDEQALERLRRKMDDNSDEEYQQSFDAINWPSDDHEYESFNDYESFNSDADEQYVTASTSYNANETFYFMSDEYGVHGGHELGCSMAERWGNVLWNVPSRIDRNIEDEFPNHDVKLSRSYRIEPDKEHPWSVEKRVYRVTKRQ